jgi:hypothetical protein
MVLEVTNKYSGAARSEHLRFGHIPGGELLLSIHVLNYIRPASSVKYLRWTWTHGAQLNVAFADPCMVQIEQAFMSVLWAQIFTLQQT